MMKKLGSGYIQGLGSLMVVMSLMRGPGYIAYSRKIRSLRAELETSVLRFTQSRKVRLPLGPKLDVECESPSTLRLPRNAFESNGVVRN